VTTICPPVQTQCPANQTVCPATVTACVAPPPGTNCPPPSGSPSALVLPVDEHCPVAMTEAPTKVAPPASSKATVGPVAVANDVGRFAQTMQ